MLLPHGTMREAFFFEATFDAQMETKQVVKGSRSSIHAGMYIHRLVIELCHIY